VYRRTLALIITIACIPLLGTILAIVITSKPDLSELIPSNPQVGDYNVLSWRELLQTHHELSSVAAKLDGAAVQALGYMVEGDKAIHPGDFVQDFVLLPDAGNILDPADRFGDQMVSVRLKEGERISVFAATVWFGFGAHFGCSRAIHQVRPPLYHLKMRERNRRPRGYRTVFPNSGTLHTVEKLADVSGLTLAGDELLVVAERDQPSLAA